MKRRPSPKKKPKVEILSPQQQLDELAAKIRETHEMAGKAFRQGMEGVLKCGGWLNEAEKLVPHGEWENWVEGKCGFSYRTSQVYKAVAWYVEQMPQHRELILSSTLHVAHYHYAQKYKRQLRQGQLKYEKIGPAIEEGLRQAGQALAQMKKRIEEGEDGGLRWKVYLNELGGYRELVLFLLECPDKDPRWFPVAPAFRLPDVPSEPDVEPVLPNLLVEDKERTVSRRAVWETRKAAISTKRAALARHLDNLDLGLDED
jgi:hypothetical protein